MSLDFSVSIEMIECVMFADLDEKKNVDLLIHWNDRKNTVVVEFGC